MIRVADIDWEERQGLRDIGLDGLQEWVLICKAFTRKGKPYPRLTLAMSEEPFRKGCFILSCRYKHNSKGWWVPIGVPRPLLHAAARVWDAGISELNRREREAKLRKCGMDIASMKPRRLYRIYSHNLPFGVWNPETKGFLGIRLKFDQRFVFTEYHCGHTYFPTATPCEDLGIDLPEDILLAENLPGSWSRDEGQAHREVEWVPDDPEGGPGTVGTWYYKDTGEVCPQGGFFKENKALFEWLDAREKEVG